MILITGCDSTAGRALVNELVSKNLKVRCHDIDAPKNLPSDCEIISGVLSSQKDIKNALDGVETLIHFLEIPESAGYGRKFMKYINIDLPQELLIAAAASGVSHAVIRSTWQVYGQAGKTPAAETAKLSPFTQFGKDRRFLETFCSTPKVSPLKISIIRPALTLGPDTDNISVLLMLYLALAQDRENRAHIISGGKNNFEFLEYSDLAKAVALIIDKKAEGIFNLSGGGAPASAAIMEIFKKFEPQIKLFNFSSLKANFYSFFLNKIRSHHLTGDHKLILSRNLVMDTSSARQVLNWIPKYDTLSTFEKMINWYRKDKMKINS